MKLRTVLAGFVAVVIIATGCHESPVGDDFTDRHYNPEGAVVTPLNVVTGFFDLADPANSSIAFDLESKGEQVQSTDILVSHTTSGERLFRTVQALPATITVSMDEVLVALDRTIDEVAVGDVVRFTFRVTTASGTYRSSRLLNVPFSCFSDLAGELDYVSTAHFCGAGPLSGTVTLAATGAGRYSFSDWAFGTYEECYGGAAPGWGSLQLNDVCNRLHLTGLDAFGDAWEFVIVDVSGTDLTGTWSNTFGEFGTVRLTRKDGRDWPALSN